MQDGADVHGVTNQVERPRDGKESVRERVFARWMNVFLQRREPPLEVRDLLTDVRDGRILMALLEELSGCKLLYRFRSSPHRIFRLDNIYKVLTFLDDHNVKLLGIDASGVVDGVPSVVLGLIWNIILHFQVKKATGGLNRGLSLSLPSSPRTARPSSGDLSLQPDHDGSCCGHTLPSRSRRAAGERRYRREEIDTLLQRVQRCTSEFGVEVHDFGRSWRSGVVFLAMIKSVNPTLVNLRESLSKEPPEIIHQAFMIALHGLHMPRLLEPEDVACSSPDERSIITYVSMFLARHSRADEVPSTDTEVDIPEIPNYGSVESVSFGETLAEDAESRDLLRRLEESSELELWRRWARRSSGGNRLHGLQKRTSGHVRRPPSPLDAGGVGQEIRSWMEENPGGPRAEQSSFSLSSEEGIYSLAAPDRDEEDAFGFIPDVSREVFQPYGRLKRERDSAERSRSRGGFHVDGKESVGGGVVLKKGSGGEGRVKRVVTGRRNDGEKERGEDREENLGPLTDGRDNAASPAVEADCRETERGEDGEEEKWPLERTKKGAGDDGNGGRRRRGLNLATAEMKTERTFVSRDKEENGREERESNGAPDRSAPLGPNLKHRMLGIEGCKPAGTAEGSGAAGLKNHKNGGRGASPPSRSQRGFFLQVLPASCEITPLELEILAALWILLYCCLILRQINL